jgi:hypothetical protein
MASLGVPGTAHADETSDLCLADSIEGQVLKAHGRFTRAREHLERCAAPACEENMRTRCAAWRDEVVAKTPVLQIHAQDDRGHAIDDVVVRLDGAVIDPSRPVPLDQGPHAVRADHAGRHFELSLPEPKPGVQDVIATIDLRDRVPTRPTPPSFWLLSGTAGAGFLAFGAFGVATLVQESNLRACSPYCDASGKGPLQATEIGADIGLGIGVAAALAATFAYLARSTVMKEVRIGSQGVLWAF